MDEHTFAFVNALEWAIYDVEGDDEAPAVQALWLAICRADDGFSLVVPRAAVEAARHELANLGRLTGAAAADAILKAQPGDIITLAV